MSIEETDVVRSRVAGCTRHQCVEFRSTKSAEQRSSLFTSVNDERCSQHHSQQYRWTKHLFPNAKHVQKRVENDHMAAKWLYPQPPLFPTVQVQNLPVMRPQTPVNARVEPLDGPPTTVFSVHQRFLTESCCRRLEGVVLCQNDELRCSVSENVSGRRTVPVALSLYIQVKFSPVNLDPTCLQTCHDPTYGPQTAVSSNIPHFPREMWHGVSVRVEFRRSGVRDERDERRWTFVCEQQRVSDALVSSSRTLLNNKVCCLHRPEKRVLQLVSVGERELCSAYRHTEDSTQSCRLPGLTNKVLHWSVNRNVEQRTVRCPP
jgi:hypothetical protein